MKVLHTKDLTALITYRQAVDQETAPPMEILVSPCLMACTMHTAIRMGYKEMLLMPTGALPWRSRRSKHCRLQVMSHLHAFQLLRNCTCLAMSAIPLLQLQDIMRQAYLLFCRQLSITATTDCPISCFDRERRCSVSSYAYMRKASSSICLQLLPRKAKE